MRLFDKGMSTPIVLDEKTDAAVRIAAADLQGNLRRLSGKGDGFEILASADGGAIRVHTEEGEGIEAYTIRVTRESVEIVGTDLLGTVYGIYAFATRCLGIVPVYRLIDIFPEAREEMELSEQVFTSAPRTVRFRGWFLNDEDL